jgi:lysophospholipase L1-like esterase
MWSTRWHRRQAVAVSAVTLALLATGLVVQQGGLRDDASPAAVEASPLTVSGVLGLGDSVPVGAACGCPSFVTLLGDQLSHLEDRAVHVVNNAQNGLTSAGLLHQVLDEHAQAPVSQVTLVTIGANDFDGSQLSAPGCSAPDLRCFAPAMSALRHNVAAVVEALVAKREPHGPLLVTGYWNVLLDGAVGAARGPVYQRDSDALTRQVNAALQDACRQTGVTYVDLYDPFKADHDGDDTRLLAPDGDHPSAAGHAVITSALMAALQQPVHVSPGRAPRG